MRHNCLGYNVLWFWPKFCPKCTIVLKEDFWGKLTKVLQFWAKLDTNYRFTLKKGIFFWKNILMLILTTSCTLSKYYNVQKKLIKVDHKIQGCIIFGQIGLGYFFGGKLTIVTFVNLLHPIILKSLN